MTKSESINSDEQTKFKNDLIEYSLDNKEKENEGFEKVFSLKSKNIHNSQFIATEDEDDKLFKLKKVKINENILF